MTKLPVFESSPSIPLPERAAAIPDPQRAEASSPAQPEASAQGSRDASSETRVQGSNDTCTPPTARTPTPVIDRELLAPDLYLNRELTWLSFNLRVLHEGEDRRTPLLERVKFLAITASNLDEFFMKRIGGLKQQEGARMPELTVDGRTPWQQITESYRMVRE
ncbi:MAG TPA: RNA degradosome polyphosphate kinase, partial [Haliangium sp.]|nr:RNA degradosome polyphosphate kinase [Haliangium sp.]